MAQLTEYLRAAHSAYHVVWFTQSVLEDAGFEELDLRKGFDLKAGGKYYCSPYPTSLFAFRVGKKIKSGSMHIACAHTDSPTFRVKPAADLGEKSGTFRINVEPYGGSLKRTWFDRPLGLAGTVLVRGKNPTPEMCSLAEDFGIALLSTDYPMFKACGLLYSAGLGH